MPRTTFVCTFENCSATFQHKERYENHLRTHSGERPFICVYDNCEKSYKRHSHLKRHELTHGSKFKCTVSGCSQMLKSKAYLKKHIDLVHMNKKPKKYKCSVCNELFFKHTALQKHSYIHTGIIPFLCPESGCDKSFLLPCKLKQHLKSHNKSYSCDQPNCKEQFPKWSLLVSHRRECHTKIHKCTVCGKKFTLMYNFKNHCLTHDEEKKIFKCPVPNCINFFEAKLYLSRHLSNFHKKRPITCSENGCHRFFKTEEEKAKHMKCRHQPKQKKEPPPRPDFANILAGFEKGTKKELNPQLSIDEFNQEPVNATEISNSESIKNSFEGGICTCSTEFYRQNNRTCTDTAMGQMLS